jgi:hypothetical protein
MIQLKLYVSVGQANGYHGNAPNESGRIGQAAIFYFFIFFCMTSNQSITCIVRDSKHQLNN